MSPLLARRRLRTVPHLRGPLGQRTHLVRRLPRQVLLLEKYANRGDQDGDTVPLLILVRGECARFNQSAIGVPKKGEQVLQVRVV